MPKLAVSALDYIELGVSDPAAWRAFAEDVLGLACEATADALNLRMDADAWRIRVVATGEDDVRTLGFRVEGPATVAAIAERLERVGVPVREASATDRAAREVDGLWYCSDPGGLRVELFTGTRPSGGPFISPRAVRGFVTGAQGFGHVVVMVPDAAKADAFFRTGLGMTLSDQITLGPPGRQILLTFLHCNPRHHTLAFAQAPTPKRLNHFMVQALEMDDVGYALDRAVAAGTPISSSLGKHTNDRMTSFYARTPSGFDVEFGWGGIEVDDATWAPTHYDSGSLWGHRRPGAH
jgi:2,3-dihydroxybiphenyl 1,2-dioxygenase